MDKISLNRLIGTINTVTGKSAAASNLQICDFSIISRVIETLNDSQFERLERFLSCLGPAIDSDSFREWSTAKRKLAGLTQTVLAQKVDLTQDVVSKYESDARELPPRKLAEIKMVIEEELFKAICLSPSEDVSRSA